MAGESISYLHLFCTHRILTILFGNPFLLLALGFPVLIPWVLCLFESFTRFTHTQSLAPFLQVTSPAILVFPASILGSGHTGFHWNLEFPEAKTGLDKLHSMVQPVIPQINFFWNSSIVSANAVALLAIQKQNETTSNLWATQTLEIYWAHYFPLTGVIPFLHLILPLKSIPQILFSQFLDSGKYRDFSYLLVLSIQRISNHHHLCTSPSSLSTSSTNNPFKTFPHLQLSVLPAANL